jgi:hypothetical protein
MELLSRIRDYLNKYRRGLSNFHGGTTMNLQNSESIAKSLGIDVFKYTLTPTIFWEYKGQKFKAQLDTTSQNDMFKEMQNFIKKSKEIADGHESMTDNHPWGLGDETVQEQTNRHVAMFNSIRKAFKKKNEEYAKDS